MKRISAILLSLVIAITVAGCGSNNSPQASSSPSASATPSQAASETPADPVELTFMVFETPNLTAAFWDNAIKKVTDKHPNIKIKKIVSPDIDRVKYAKQLLATGELPDVMIAVNPAEFASSGAMLPFEDEYLKAFKYPMANAIDGKQYQLPWNTQTYPNMFYNKKIFAEVGVQPPTTWAEFLDISDKIKKAGYTPFLLGGGKDPWATTLLLVNIIGLDVYGKTPDWVSKRKKGEVKFADGDFKAAVAKWKDLIDKKYYNENGLSLNYGQLEEEWFKGQAAMYLMGSWYLSADAAKQKDWEVGLFPLPSSEGEKFLPMFTGGGTSVSAKTKHPKEAQIFAAEFASNPEIMAEFMKTDGSIPALNVEVPFEGTPLFNDMLKMLGEVKGVNSFGVEAGDDALLPGIKDAFDKMAQNLILGADLDTELAKLDKLWDETAARQK